MWKWITYGALYLVGIRQYSRLVSIFRFIDYQVLFIAHWMIAVGLAIYFIDVIRTVPAYYSCLWQLGIVVLLPWIIRLLVMT